MALIPYPDEKVFRQYVGIDFNHGTTDCYGLVRRVYAEVFQINLRDYSRPDNWWDHEGYNLYMDNFQKEGFEILELPMNDWEIGDLILMAIQSTVPCHAAIYIGNGKILHHFYGRKSSIENYCRIWKNTTVAVIRHRELKFEKPEEYAELLDDDRIKSFILLQQERARAWGDNNQNGTSGV